MRMMCTQCLVWDLSLPDCLVGFMNSKTKTAQRPTIRGKANKAVTPMWHEPDCAVVTKTSIVSVTR
jgi:hypothetical protein